MAEILGGCNDTIKKLLTVTEIPNCNFAVKSYFLSGGLGYKFEPTITSNTTYEWTFGEGGYATQISPIYQYNSSGVYKVKLVSTNNGGCKCESTQIVSAFPSSVKDIKASKISIYPNPANNLLNIFISNLNDASLNLFNALGQSVFSTNFKEETIINTENLASGIYSLQVKNNGISEIIKIIITH